MLKRHVYLTQAKISRPRTWRGFVYVIDVFSRRIVCRRASTTMRTDLALDALEQALCSRETEASPLHPSDRDCQNVCIRSTIG